MNIKCSRAKHVSSNEGTVRAVDEKNALCHHDNAQIKDWRQMSRHFFTYIYRVSDSNTHSHTYIENLKLSRKLTAKRVKLEYFTNSI